MHPPGWTEISAVCTDPAHRGQGLAARLVRAVAVGIREHGDVPFLHAAADNHAGIRLYERLGSPTAATILFAAMQAAQRSESNSEAMAAQWRSAAARRRSLSGTANPWAAG